MDTAMEGVSKYNPRLACLILQMVLELSCSSCLPAGYEGEAFRMGQMHVQQQAGY